MSEQDDWARFVAMMEREGWVYDADPDWFQKGKIAYCPNGILYYDAPPGVHTKSKQVGDWRQWFAAGQPPPTEAA